jgi:hypothetical protein
VICGGGHTLISEALYLGKPVLSFPIRFAGEQEVNAAYLDRLGYGMGCASSHPTESLIHTFETGLAGFRSAIRSETFLGNPDLFNLIGRFVETGSIG